MSDEEALLRAIDEEPDDDLPRLAYADWLEEHGRVPRAEFIRLQCRLAGMPPLHPDRLPLEVGEAELLNEHDAAWGREVWRGPSPAVVGGFVRGFPLVRVRGASHLESLSDRPLGGLSVSLPEQSDRAFWQSRHLARVDTLRVFGVCDEIHVQDVADCPHLSRLRCLELHAEEARSAGPYHDGILALAESPYLANLRRLTLTDGGTLRSKSLEALAEAPWAWGLRHLALAVPDMGGKGIESLCRSPALSRLESLDLSWDHGLETTGRLTDLVESATLTSLRFLRYQGGIGAAELGDLAGSEALGRLRGLSLEGALDDEDAAALSLSPHVNRLYTLHLRGGAIGPRSARALACSPGLANLRCLALTDAEVGDAGAKEIAEGASMANLLSLSLATSGVGDDGARALAKSYHLGGLLRLDLSHCRLTDDGARALAGSKALRRLRVLYLGGNEAITDHGFSLVRTSSRFRLVNDPRQEPPREG